MTANLVSLIIIIVDTRLPWQRGQRKLNRPNEKWGGDCQKFRVRAGV
jgi:hypothetical protein